MQHFGVDAAQALALPAFMHIFTHFKLYITPLLVQVIHKPTQVQEQGNVWLVTEEALHAAIPTPVRKLLQQVQARRILNPNTKNTIQATETAENTEKACRL